MYKLLTADKIIKNHVEHLRVLQSINKAGNDYITPQISQKVIDLLENYACGKVSLKESEQGMSYFVFDRDIVQELYQETLRPTGIKGFILKSVKSKAHVHNSEYNSIFNARVIPLNLCASDVVFMNTKQYLQQSLVVNPFTLFFDYWTKKLMGSEEITIMTGLSLAVSRMAKAGDRNPNKVITPFKKESFLYKLHAEHNNGDSLSNYSFAYRQVMINLTALTGTLNTLLFPRDIREESTEFHVMQTSLTVLLDTYPSLIPLYEYFENKILKGDLTYDCEKIYVKTVQYLQKDYNHIQINRIMSTYLPAIVEQSKLKVMELDYKK